MIKYVLLPGQRFGELIFIKEVRIHTKVRAALIKCACGNEVIRSIYSLITGNTKSCGCFRKKTSKASKTKFKLVHGKTGTRVWQTWGSMLRRCRDPKWHQFHYYGGRGIDVCKRWEKFENFYTDMGDPPPGLELDRKDNNGNYEPGNCRWATRTEQIRNRRNTINITLNGETRCLTEWCNHFGIKYETVRWRINKGYPTEKLFMKLHKHKSIRRRGFIL